MPEPPFDAGEVAESAGRDAWRNDRREEPLPTDLTATSSHDRRWTLRFYEAASGVPRRLRASGELDIATAPGLEVAVRRYAVAGSDLVLDIRDVSFIDSVGLRAILVSHQHCERNTCSLALEASLPVRQRFDVYGVFERLVFV